MQPTHEGQPGSQPPALHAGPGTVPAEPVPDTGKVISFVVWKTIRKSFLMSSITLTKSGSRWPTSGDSIAFITRGWTFEGPGPSRIRAAG